jgi:hypothetical protein
VSILSLSKDAIVILSLSKDLRVPERSRGHATPRHQVKG